MPHLGPKRAGLDGESGSCQPCQSAVVTGGSLREEVEMPEEKNDKALAPTRESAALSEVAKAVQPLIEAWNNGETDRIRIAAESTERSEIRQLRERRWQLGLPLVAVLFLIVFLYLKDRSAEASDLLKFVVSLAGGASVGWGFGYSRGKRKQAEKE